MVSRLQSRKVEFAIVDTCFYKLSELALLRSLAEFEPSQVLIFSDRQDCWPAGSKIIPIGKIKGKDDYNRIIIEELPYYLSAEFCIVLQYDGFILDSSRWEANFLEFDYLGAPWPNYSFHNVGNGGFSLRSRRLIQSLSGYAPLRGKDEAEDVFLGRTVRPLLESRHGIQFAPPDVALRFSFESPGHPKAGFGFHGVLNLAIAYAKDIEGFFDAAPVEMLRGRRLELEFGARFLNERSRNEFLERLTLVQFK